MSQDDVGDAGLFVEACEWLARIESGREEDLIAFDEWLCADVRHVDQVLKLQALIFETQRVIRQDPDRLQRARHARRVISFPASRHVSRGAELQLERPRDPHISDRWVGVVASLLIYVLAILFVGDYLTPTTYQTAAGESRVVVLPDGSRAHLRGLTCLRVWMHGHRREIELLAGEAFFDVVHDPLRPFHVTARGVIAQALGTRFDVQQRADAVNVVVASGRVAVSIPTPSAGHAVPLELATGQRASVPLRGGAPELRTLSARQMRSTLAWMEGTVALQNTTLREAVEEFNRVNLSQIVIDDPAIADLRLGGTFYSHEPESFIRALREYGVIVQTRESGGATEWHLTRGQQGEPPDSVAGSGRIESVP